ncbi:hypothetical protein [Aliikangiella maris]|uniref:Uncharacterized protein n=2 Tax=Aliikangiella maris TaxID=3162458 RepID=A0ABV3MS55_9GAMM
MKLYSFNLAVSILLLSCLSFTRQTQATEIPQGMLYYSFEANGEDYIAGIGTGLKLYDEDAPIGVILTTSLNYAEVTTERGYTENYTAWEAAFKVGHFSDFSVYLEAGFDLSELIFHDLRYSDDHIFYTNDSHHDHDHYDDNIDAYVGIGAGFRLGGLGIEAFSKLREIDSRNWEAEAEVFSGITFSINF